MAALVEALQAVAERLDPALPDCLPILGYGLWSTSDGERPRDQARRPDPDRPEDPGRPATEPGQRAEPDQPRADLPTLLSRVLLAFAIEFEHESPVSLAISANVLRVLDENNVRIRDLARLSGVSKEGISMAMGILTKHGLAVSGPATDGGRGQVATLTPKGRSVQNKCRERLSEIEHRWQERFGGERVTALREALERLTSGPGSRLSEGLDPPQGGWRAGEPRKATLPQYPMVLHRGGFPDGS